MNPLTRGLLAIAAGVAAYSAAVVFLSLLLPFGLRYFARGVSGLGFIAIFLLAFELLSPCAGALAGGFVAARVASENKLAYSAATAALLWMYSELQPGTPERIGAGIFHLGRGIPLTITVLFFLFFFVGAWIGIQKKDPIEPE
jgi:hypothetical protein